MELFHPYSHSLCHVEVSKVVGASWFFIPENSVGGLGRNMDRSLPQSAVLQANLEGIHAIIRPGCVVL